jgi:hypothetical protein
MSDFKNRLQNLRSKYIQNNIQIDKKLKETHKKIEIEKKEIDTIKKKIKIGEKIKELNNNFIYCQNNDYSNIKNIINDIKFLIEKK